MKHEILNRSQRRETSMTKLTAMGLTLFMAAPLMAGSFPAVTYNVQYPSLTRQESLERDVRIAQNRIESPVSGKVLVAQQERAQARLDLAVAQSRLEAFKTAGPKMDIPVLEQAIRDDHFAIEHANNGDKFSYVQMRRQTAEAKLAQDQAALDALK
jgi:hypothetical protein